MALKISKCSGCKHMVDLRMRPNVRGEYYCRHPYLDEMKFIGSGKSNTHCQDRKTVPNFCPIVTNRGD